MYSKYCDIKGWKLEVSSANEGAAGGFKEIICSVTGENVYGTLKYESGVHRVQRVPAHGDTGPCAYLGRLGSRTARSRRVRRGDQRRRNQVGHLPKRRCRRPKREQGRIGRTSALQLEEPADGCRRGNPHRVYRDGPKYVPTTIRRDASPTTASTTPSTTWPPLWTATYRTASTISSWLRMRNG